MEKRESHKGCSVFLPCHLFIPLCCTPDLQEAHPRAWDETHSVTCFPSKCCMISFLDVFIDHHGYKAAAQFPLCGSEEFRAATHPEGFSVLTIPSPFFASLVVHTTRFSVGSQPRGWSTSSAPVMPAHCGWIGTSGLLSVPSRQHSSF